MILKSYEIEKFKNNVENKNIFLLYGENYGIKKDIRNTIQTSINKNTPDLEKITLFEEDLIKNIESFYNLIFSGSLFSTKKIITIFNSSDKITNHIKDVIDKFPKNIFLILFSEILDKKSKLRNLFEKNNKIICVPCYADNEKSLQLIAMNELTKNQITLTRESLNLIIQKSQGDRNNLRNELEKIQSFSKDNKKVDYENVKSLVNSHSEIRSDDFVNLCLNGDTLELKKILEDSPKEYLNYIFLLKTLSNKIRRLLSIKEQNNENKNLDIIINSLKPPIFWKEKPFVKKQLNLWNLRELKKTIYEINDVEISCKKNPNLSSIIFLNFITNLCKKVNYQT